MSATIILIIITVAVSWWAWQRPELQAKFMMNPFMIVHRRQWYRLISSGFIHANWMHLGFNMFTFFFFGRIVETYLMAIFGDIGLLLFLVLYFLAMVVADISTIRKFKDQIHYNALGASGAVSAVVFSSIMFAPLNPLCLYGLLCLPGFIFGALYVIYSYYQGKRMADHINHDAHLYGAIFGVVFTIIVWPAVLPHFVEQLMEFSLF